MLQNKETITIIINGNPKALPYSYTLKECIQHFCRDARHVIAELNGKIIKSPEWEKVQLSEGDTLELINFVGGG